MNLEDLYNMLKSFIAAAFTALFNFFLPIHNFFVVIAILATIDIVSGIVADGKWEKKKAWKAFVYLLLYFFLLLIVFAVGIMMKVATENVTNFADWITWVMIYFYASNIIRNWHIKWPDSKVISFMYWVITIKFVEKIDFLGEFLKQKKDGKSR